MTRGGMTLLEVTIGLVVVSSVLVGGYELYATAQSVVERVDTSLDELATEAIARSTVSGWLRHPVIGPGVGFYGFDQKWQGLDDDRLQFWVANLIPGLPGLSRLELLVDRDDTTVEVGLVALIVTPPDPRPKRFVISPNVGSLDVKFRPAGIREGLEVDAWQSESIAPGSVLIRLQPSPGRELPPLLAQEWIVTVGAWR